MDEDLEKNHKDEKKLKRNLKYERSKKNDLIAMLGDSCKKCGLKYDGNNGAVFDFHHRDPQEKLFSLKAKNLTRKRWEEITAEAQKCDLLCANCHRMIHYNSF